MRSAGIIFFQRNSLPDGLIKTISLPKFSSFKPLKSSLKVRFARTTAVPLRVSTIDGDMDMFSKTGAVTSCAPVTLIVFRSSAGMDSLDR